MLGTESHSSIRPRRLHGGITRLVHTINNENGQELGPVGTYDFFYKSDIIRKVRDYSFKNNLVHVAPKFSLKEPTTSRNLPIYFGYDFVGLLQIINFII